MFESLMFALIAVFIGILPSLISGQWKIAVGVGIFGTFVGWWLFYMDVPSAVFPCYGHFIILAIIWWIISASFADAEGKAPPIGAIVVTLVVVAICAFIGSDFFRSSDYARLIGDVEKREWTQDIQPKDPKHVRLVPLELAYYLATKQLGEAKGAVGSQFQINKEDLTLQLIKGELWYVAPLDYKGFKVWTSAGSAPGYVMVHAEDPKMPVVVKTDCKFTFMPGAYFSENLERHVWKETVGKYILTDFSFEVDESGSVWWVVTAYKPTIMWSGPKVCGVYIVNPTTGEMKLYPIGSVPSWVDRVVPGHFVEYYAKKHGEFTGGWLNSWWGHKDLTEPEEPSLIYGSDAKPYWVTGITSRNENDSSLIGLLYTDAQTGKSIEYHAIGGTEEAIVNLVNNKVSFRKLHGSSPVLYNIYGVMTAIVPLLGESHSYQGVAMVDVANMQLAVGDDLESTIRQYQKLVMSGSAQKLSPEKAHNLHNTTGVVDRISREVSGNETVYYIHVQNFPHLLSGSSDLSPKLRVVENGDSVVIGYVLSDEDVVPMSSFDIPALVLMQSKNQVQLGEKVAERQAQVTEKRDVQNARGEVQNMTDEQIKELIRLRNKK